MAETLSERELEILRLVATGATNKEVAQRLHISTNTVKVHLRNIYAKLGVSSRTEATMTAVREGLVAVPDSGAVAKPVPPPPPLPRSRRIAMVVLVLLAVGAALLSWPRPVPSAPSLAWPLPAPTARRPFPEPEEESRWMERAQMPTRRAWLGLAPFGRKLYAIGGRGPNGVTGAVEVYNVAEDSWERAASKPTPAAYVSATILDGRLWVPGGCTENGTALSVVETYLPATDSWETGPDLPTPLCAYAMVTYQDKLFLFGGTDGETYLATTFMYDPARGEWEERAPMPEGRALAGAATMGGRVYVVGGYRDGRTLKSCAVYDPEADSWAACAPLTMARSGLGLVALGRQLYAVGGGGLGGYQGFNERYDAAADQWAGFETPLTGGWQGAGISSLEGAVYAVGGYSDDYLSLTFVFEPFPCLLPPASCVPPPFTGVSGPAGRSWVRSRAKRFWIGPTFAAVYHRQDQPDNPEPRRSSGVWQKRGRRRGRPAQRHPAARIRDCAAYRERASPEAGIAPCTRPGRQATMGGGAASVPCVGGGGRRSESRERAVRDQRGLCG